MKRRVKDRGVRERVDKIWEVRTRRKGSRMDRRRREGSVIQKIEGCEVEVRERGKEKQRGRERRTRLSGREGKGSEVRNRCVDTGHGRSIIRWFRKSGRKVRERARGGKLEGVYIVSW